MNRDYVSKKNIPSEERLIFALDVATIDEAKSIVEELGESVVFYKLGLQLLTSGNYFTLIDWLIAKNKKLFLDLKFFDIPQTVQSAVKNLATGGATFATIHGNDRMLEAAVSVKGELKILAVTVLTSMDEDDDAKDLGFQVNIKDLVLSRAKRAIQLNCDGVIASGLEARDLRNHYGDDFIIVSPGIRPFKNDDDQKRTVDIEEAFHNGVDYIVIGRPIREHHGFSSKREAAEHIQQRISQVFV